MMRPAQPPLVHQPYHWTANMFPSRAFLLIRSGYGVGGDNKTGMGTRDSEYHGQDCNWGSEAHRRRHIFVLVLLAIMWLYGETLTWSYASFPRICICRLYCGMIGVKHVKKIILASVWVIALFWPWGTKVLLLYLSWKIIVISGEMFVLVTINGSHTC
jgi:hypothetical protein